MQAENQAKIEQNKSQISRLETELLESSEAERDDRRFAPNEMLFFDYALTVSNGRGPMDTIYDLDDNKGLGLRLKMTYEGSDVLASLGGYGYYGDYTDLKKVIESLTPQFRVRQEITESYSEIVGALDLLIEFYGTPIRIF